MPNGVTGLEAVRSGVAVWHAQGSSYDDDIDGDSGDNEDNDDNDDGHGKQLTAGHGAGHRPIRNPLRFRVRVEKHTLTCAAVPER